MPYTLQLKRRRSSPSTHNCGGRITWPSVSALTNRASLSTITMRRGISSSLARNGGSCGTTVSSAWFTKALNQLLSSTSLTDTWLVRFRSNTTRQRDFALGDGDEILPSAEWIRQMYPRVKEEVRAHGADCIQHAGEMMFVPNKMMHMVVNIGDTVSVISEVGLEKGEGKRPEDFEFDPSRMEEEEEERIEQNSSDDYAVESSDESSNDRWSGYDSSDDRYDLWTGYDSSDDSQDRESSSDD